MAEALFNEVAKGKAVAVSAGTEPAAQVNSTVLTAMREVGIEIGDKRPKLLTAEMLESVDRVITMGCNAAQACPASSVPEADWELDDPEGKPIEKVRQIRDQIKIKVDELVRTLL